MAKPCCIECNEMISPGEVAFEVREVEAERNGVKTSESLDAPALVCSAGCLARYGVYLLEEFDDEEE